MFLLALNPPNPDHPQLLAVESGKALEYTQQLIRRYQERNRTARRRKPGPQQHSNSVTVTGNTAVASECVIDDLIQYDASDTPVDTDISSVVFNTTLHRTPDGWNVVDRQRSGSPVKGTKLCEHLESQL